MGTKRVSRSMEVGRPWLFARALFSLVTLAPLLANVISRARERRLNFHLALGREIEQIAQTKPREFRFRCSP
jgi:hypothetical protein